MTYNNTIKNFAATISFIATLTGCSSAFKEPIVAPPQIASHTKSGDMLAALPPAKNKIVVSVYEFQDQTGQMKPNDTYADYSRAVTQGGLAILNKALLDASHKGWFTVIERGGIKNLLQERQIVKITRAEYQDPKKPMSNIKPLLYSGIIIEGGIIAYESNVATGGLGAKYLGVGGDTQYRRDIVTVYLRAVSTQTGEILTSVNTSKTIYSTAVDASIFRYVSFDKLLEVETGVAFNEPAQFAVRQAIEMGVYALIMEGAMDNLWEFQNPQAGKAAIADYLKRRDGETSTRDSLLNGLMLPGSSEPVAVEPVKPDALPVHSAVSEQGMVNTTSNSTANLPVAPFAPATKNDAVESTVNTVMPTSATAHTADQPTAVKLSAPANEILYLPENRYSVSKSKEDCNLGESGCQ